MTNNTITARITRYMAMPIVSAGIIGGAALGMAGMANADPVGPGYQYSPTTTAAPAPEAQPGWHNHHGVHHIENLNPYYTR
ncbi:MAG: hypothetical protein QOD39_2125 [Mycobacterium sp.]|nr:hypothetical protein [Mycobacterium sp.]